MDVFMDPYQNLALAVLTRAIQDLEVEGQEDSALAFLTKENHSLEFWSGLADIDPDLLLDNRLLKNKKEE